ncbi:hypothetical protein GPU91_06640 [Streptococcus thermophilus]|nr:hypothetical protein Y016_09415 [Streptococcus thermophilus TH985]EWM57356.1 hypothetical protein Y018_09350 [Streptococcus thermophilus TH982]MCE2092588.1 hypothetical protein [Streptococcus thermophilus]MCE2097448.1 hypothetical protein [Streptococcus thermophilus]
MPQYLRLVGLVWLRQLIQLVKPALGVGAGNVPSYIAADAKVKRAVNDLIVSKTF